MIRHSSAESSSLRRRLLLRKTVQRAEPPHEIHGMNAGDRVPRKRFSDSVERDAVVGIVERRYKNSAIGDVEVRVAGGEALAVHEHGARKRNGHDLQLVLLRGYLEAAEIIGRSQMVFIRGIVL